MSLDFSQQGAPGNSSLERPGFNRSYEPYSVESFTEVSDPDKALHVQQMQGGSYVRFGIADPSVLEEDGRLPHWLDHSRGEHVTYYLARPNEAMGMTGLASARVVNGTLDTLAAYTGCLENIDPKEKERLQEYREQGVTFREIGAVALTADAQSIATFCIVRDIVQSAIRSGGDEVMLGRQTPVALKGFKLMFGEVAVRQIGKATKLDAGGGLTVELTPVVGRINESFDKMLENIHDQRIDDKRRAKLSQSLLFLLDGLYASEVSDGVNRFAKDTFNLSLPEKV